jgi:hypothetical protein
MTPSRGSNFENPHGMVRHSGEGCPRTVVKTPDAASLRFCSGNVPNSRTFRSLSPFSFQESALRLVVCGMNPEHLPFGYGTRFG